MKSSSWILASLIIFNVLCVASCMQRKYNALVECHEEALLRFSDLQLNYKRKDDVLRDLSRFPDSSLEVRAVLEGAENRIKYYRLEYNDAVNAYNLKLLKYPSKWYADLFGFEALPYSK